MRKLILAIALILAPAVCRAQHAERWRDSAQRLDAAVKLLRDSLLSVDSNVAEVARRGDLVVSASSNLRATAAVVLEKFARARDRRFAGAMPSPGGFRIVVRTDNSANGHSDALSNGSIVLSGLPDSGSAARAQLSRWEPSSVDRVIDQYGRMLIASIPALSEWLENPPPLSMDDAQRRDEAMYALVTSTGAIERRCVSGGAPACRVALKLKLIPGPENGGRFSPFMRTDLLYYALDRGGAGAWERLRTAADSGINAALAAAAQMPMDSLVLAWRSDLLARRPVAATLGGRWTAAALGWSLLLAIGAIGASKWA